MEINFSIFFLSAIVPLVVGFIWYNPKTFGNAWMNAAGVTSESAKGANMFLVFGLTYLFSVFASVGLFSLVNHSSHMFSLLSDEPGFKVPSSAVGLYLSDFMKTYGHHFHSFKHGVLHGTIGGITFALPVIAVNALFERKGFKYVAINAGFWIVCFAIMGGIICQFA